METNFNENQDRLDDLREELMENRCENTGEYSPCGLVVMLDTATKVEYVIADAGWASTMGGRKVEKSEHKQTCEKCKNSEWF